MKTKRVIAAPAVYKNRYDHMPTRFVITKENFMSEQSAMNGIWDYNFHDDGSGPGDYSLEFHAWPAMWDADNGVWYWGEYDEKQDQS